MPIYRKKKTKNIIKQHLKLLSYNILVIIGFLSLCNYSIEYLKSLPDITQAKTITIYNRPVSQAIEASITSEPITYIEHQNEKKTLTGQFSAYNAEVNQTDADPFTMANGKKVFEGAIANNCLDFGTKIKINDHIYTVSDRMNKRYDCNHFDIFLFSYSDAIKFGRQSLEYEIL